MSDIIVPCVVSDINECDVLGTCDQACSNRYGSHYCMCVAGYIPVKVRNGDVVNTICKAQGPMEYLLIGMEDRILMHSFRDYNQHLETIYPPAYVSTNTGGAS